MLLPDLDGAQMQFPTKVVGEATVVVMETEIGGADLTHPQLLLLETGGRHGVPVYVLHTKTLTLSLRIAPVILAQRPVNSIRTSVA